MSDDQNERPREHDEPEDEVEAHHHAGPKFGANDEPEDEVEAHHKSGIKLGANEEPAKEGDDEVEAHRLRVAAPDNQSA
jgi:hypothetical protein